MSTWVNYKDLRSRLSFELLRHYGVEIKRKGNQHCGFCPLPGHNGNRNSPSFSANLEEGIFQCFDRIFFGDFDKRVLRRKLSCQKDSDAPFVISN